MKNFKGPEFLTHQGDLHKVRPGGKDGILDKSADLDEEDVKRINKNDPEKNYIPVEEISGGNDYLKFGEAYIPKGTLDENDEIEKSFSDLFGKKDAEAVIEKVNEGSPEFSIEEMKTGVSGVAHASMDKILVSSGVKVSPGKLTSLEKSRVDEKYNEAEGCIQNKIAREEQKRIKKIAYSEEYKQRPKREENILTAKKKGKFIDKKELGEVKKGALIEDEPVFEDTYL